MNRAEPADDAQAPEERARRLSRAGKPSVILLRVQGMAAEGQAQLIRSIYQACEAAIADGAAVSADESSIRIRRLPLR